jgi:hypothetical protein
MLYSDYLSKEGKTAPREHRYDIETTTQFINIGIIIITRSTIFSSDIRKWHEKPDDDKTWPNFEDHFKAAQKAIKKTSPPSPQIPWVSTNRQTLQQALSVR